MGVHSNCVERPPMGPPKNGHDKGGHWSEVLQKWGQFCLSKSCSERCSEVVVNTGLTLPIIYCLCMKISLCVPIKYWKDNDYVYNDKKLSLGAFKTST